MANVSMLQQIITEKFGTNIISSKIYCQELTVEIEKTQLIPFCKLIHTDPTLMFDQLMDVCGIDYLQYGISEWETFSTTATGYSRGVEPQPPAQPFEKPRFAVIYHLLSTVFNHRLRIKVFLEETNLVIESVNAIWNAANWFEREAFDLFGIIFEGHPDLRRILTDYGFIGHPFRKDFPLIGNVEPRYDAKLGRVIYEPVSIVPRTLVPKVIRDDHRYTADSEPTSKR